MPKAWIRWWGNAAPEVPGFDADNDTTWTVTRCTEGPGLHTLPLGQRVRLTLDRRLDFSVVRTYDPQN